MAVGSSAAARPEVARRRFEVAAALIGLAAAQVGEHRVGTQGDGAAVGLDGAEGLVVAQGGVAAGEQRAVVALAGGRLVGERAADGGQREHGHREDRALHERSILPAHRNFRPRGLTGV